MRGDDPGEIVDVAAGRDDIGAAQRAHGLGGTLADGKNQQANEVGALGMTSDGVSDIGAGHQHGRPRARADRLTGQRLDAKKRRDDDAVAARPQRHRGAHCIGLGPRDQKPHSLRPRKKVGAGALLEFAPRVRAKRRSLAGAALAGDLVRFTAVRLGDDAAEADDAPGDARMAGDRRAAGAVEYGQKGALGGKRDRRVGIVDLGDEGARGVIIVARLKPDRALAHGRKKLIDFEHRGRRRQQPEPL